MPRTRKRVTRITTSDNEFSDVENVSQLAEDEQRAARAAEASTEELSEGDRVAPESEADVGSDDDALGNKGYIDLFD